MTKFQVEDVSPIERRFKIEVPPELVHAALDRAYKTLSHRVRIPGFRPGKVPRRILEQRFKEQVEGDVIQQLVEQSWRHTLDQSKTFAVAPPRVTPEALKAGEPFRYQAHVEVKPKVEPKDYEGLELTRKKVEVTDEQVQKELDAMREQMSEMVDVTDRGAELGDVATIDYEATVDGKPFQGSKREGIAVEVAQGELVDGKIAALVGAKAGEDKTVDYAFPADYRVEELKGKVAQFKIKVKNVQKKKLPELNDAFAKDVGGGESLQDLKEKLKKELTHAAEEKAQRESRDQVLEQLVKKNDFDVPKSMIERAIDSMIQGTAERFARQGLDVSRMGLDFNRLREDLRERATLEVKGSLLMEAVADKEKITATPEDVEKAIADLAQKNDLPVEKVRTYLSGAEEKRNLELKLRDDKTLEFLRSKAKISES